MTQSVTKSEYIDDRETQNELLVEFTYENIRYEESTDMFGTLDVYVGCEFSYSVFEEGLVNNVYQKYDVTYELSPEELKHYTGMHKAELRDDYLLGKSGEGALESVDLIDGYGEY
jgi:hypothetical protein